MTDIPDDILEEQAMDGRQLRGTFAAPLHVVAARSRSRKQGVHVRAPQPVRASSLSQTCKDRIGFRSPQRRACHFCFGKSGQNHCAGHAGFGNVMLPKLPCASRAKRAGANSAIHGLEQSRLSPEADCVARRDNGHSARKHHACSPVWFRGWRVRKTSRIGRLPPQHPIAERRVCSTQRPPARSARMSCRATQGTAFAQRTTHDVRVPFLWATFLCTSKERWLAPAKQE